MDLSYEEVERNTKIMVEAQRLLSEDFFVIVKAPSKFRCWLIKQIFPEFSNFTEKVREWYWA